VPERSLCKPTAFQHAVPFGHVSATIRAFSLLVYTGQPASARLFLKKRRTSLHLPVQGRSDNALGREYKPAISGKLLSRAQSSLDFPSHDYISTCRAHRKRGLLRRDFDLGIAAGCCSINSLYDTLDVDPKSWPLLPVEDHDCDFSAGKVLLVA
jgi:hypothetical protein